MAPVSTRTSRFPQHTPLPADLLEVAARDHARWTARVRIALQRTAQACREGHVARAPDAILEHVLREAAQMDDGLVEGPEIQRQLAELRDRLLCDPDLLVKVMDEVLDLPQ
jgi:hypothetical protein